MTIASLLPKDISSLVEKVEAIAAGRHNTFLIQLATGEKLFVKQDAEPAEAVHLDMLNKHRGLCHMVPAFKFFNESNRLLLTEYIASSAPTPFKNAELQKAMADNLLRLHQSQFTPKTNWTVSDMLRDAWAISQGDEFFSQAVSSAIHNINTNPAYLCGLHGDLIPENTLWREQQLLLIDWEYAWWGDCRWDIASFAVEFELTQREFEHFISCYQISGEIIDPNFFQGACEWRLIYLLICRDWAVTNNQPSEKYQKALDQIRLNTT